MINLVKPYKQIDGIELNLHFYLAEDYKEGAPKPGVLFFHGGGWTGGSPGQFQYQCRRLAEQGMIACSAEYRLRDSHGTTPYECVKDAKTAARWLRAHAAEFNLNEDKLASGGGSAGGHLAAALATIDIEEDSDNKEISCVPNALLLFNPVFDNSEQGYGYDRLGEKYKEISPLHNIRKGHPPTLVLLGSQDKCLPVSSVEAYHAAMTQKGDLCEFIVYEGEQHGFFNYKNGTNKYFDITMKAVEAFLRKLEFLK